jgi:hypothetical protein
MRAFLFRIELDRLTGIQRPFHAEIGNASMALYQLFGWPAHCRQWRGLRAIGECFEVTGSREALLRASSTFLTRSRSSSNSRNCAIKFAVVSVTAARR